MWCSIAPRTANTAVLYFQKINSHGRQEKEEVIPVISNNDIKSNINMFSKRSIPRRFVDATHYHKRGENPKWAHRLKYLGAYKHHLFYKV